MSKIITFPEASLSSVSLGSNGSCIISIVCTCVLFQVSVCSQNFGREKKSVCIGKEEKNKRIHLINLMEVIQINK